MELNERRKAYQEGYGAGIADRRIGYTSQYAATSFSTEPAYHQFYSRGYRDGNAGIMPRFSQVSSL